jgi:hypothetical protein
MIGRSSRNSQARARVQSRLMVALASGGQALWIEPSGGFPRVGRLASLAQSTNVFGTLPGWPAHTDQSANGLPAKFLNCAMSSFRMTLS